jgi:hypothetical protein
MTVPAIGMWWTICCLEDLYPIRNEEDLAEVLAWQADNPEDGSDGVPAHVWPDLASALADPYLTSSWPPSIQTAKRLGL